jgi:sarcosine oxidase
VFQPDGGFVVPERCIVAHVEGALRLGAVVRARERVLEWEVGENGVRVRTDRGDIEADRLVLTAGAWSQDVARLPPGLVRGVRQSLAWLQPTKPEHFAPTAFPVFNLGLDGEHFYGFPAFGIPGFKLGRYDHFAKGGDPDTIDREPSIEDEAPLRAFAERYFPGGAGPTIALKTCLFEPSPDEHFLIDRHPESELAVLGAGFSGHGFKFCSVVGEILADLALDGATRHDIGFLRLSRFPKSGLGL